MDKADLAITPCALEAIANMALERKTGARGLRSMLVSTMSVYHKVCASISISPFLVPVWLHHSYSCAEPLISTPLMWAIGSGLLQCFRTHELLDNPFRVACLF